MAKKQSGGLPTQSEKLTVFLQNQTPTVLAQQLLNWAHADSSLMAELTAWVAQTQISDDPKAVKGVKTAITALLKSSGFIDWRETSSYANQADKVIPLIEQVLETDAVAARGLTEHALRCIYKASEDADDSNGEIGEVMNGLMDLLMDCLEAAPPPASWLEDWFALMQADPWGLWDEAAVVLAAGPALQAAYSQRAAKDWQTWSVENPRVNEATPTAQAKEKSTSRILAYRHYDHARAKLRTRYLDDLKRQGDMSVLLEAMKNSVLGASEYSQLIALFESLGKKQEALLYAKTACQLHPEDWRCETALLRCYELNRMYLEALGIRRKQLEKSPTVENYKAALKTAEAAKKDCASYRVELFTWAQSVELQPRQEPSWRRSIDNQPSAQGASTRHVSTRVNWLLSEEKLDEALALVQSPNACSAALLHTIAKKLPPARDLEAVPLLLRLFEMTMPSASSPYDEVLRLVAETAPRIKQPERSHWLAMLRAEYKAKRNFIKGLDGLKIPA